MNTYLTFEIVLSRHVNLPGIPLERYNVHFDRKAKAMSLEAGDKALILLPTDSNKLLM